MPGRGRRDGAGKGWCHTRVAVGEPRAAAGEHTSGRREARVHCDEKLSCCGIALQMRDATKHSAHATHDAELLPAQTSSPYFGTALSRAILLGYLAQLIHGRSGVRPGVAQYLAALLNDSKPVPRLRQSLIAEQVIVLLCCGEAVGSVSAPGLNVSERAALPALTAPSAALATLALFGASALLPAADAVASLSIDSAGFGDAPAEVLLLDSLFNEHARNHAGQVASATNVRLMLEGSRSGAVMRSSSAAVSAAAAAAAAAPGAGEPPAAATAESPSSLAGCPLVLRTTPQLHGAAYGNLAASLKTCIIELNSALPAPSPAAGKGAAKGTAAAALIAPLPLSAAPLIAAMSVAAGGVATLLAASDARTRALAPQGTAAAAAVSSGGATADDASATPASVSLTTTLASASDSLSASLSAAISLARDVDRLVCSLANEVSACEDSVREREASAAADVAAKDVKRAAAAAARAAVEAAKLAALSPEERAKVEAEAAKKREKAAKKEAAAAAAAPPATVASTSSSANVLGLGLGVAEFRAHMASVGAAVAASPAAEISDNGTDASAVGVAVRALSPFGVAAPLLIHEAAAAAPPLSSATPRIDVFIRGLIDRIGSGGANRRRAKIVKGARDFMPEQMEVRGVDAERERNHERRGKINREGVGVIIREIIRSEIRRRWVGVTDGRRENALISPYLHVLPPSLVPSPACIYTFRLLCTLLAPA